METNSKKIMQPTTIKSKDNGCGTAPGNLVSQLISEVSSLQTGSFKPPAAVCCPFGGVFRNGSQTCQVYCVYVVNNMAFWDIKKVIKIENGCKFKGFPCFSSIFFTF